MKALLSQIRERIEGLFPLEPLTVKVFRIYRDVRFSKDKSPYKTHIGGYVATQGDRSGPSARAVLYFHIGAGELLAASGQYMMDGPQLARFPNRWGNCAPMLSSPKLVFARAPSKTRCATI